MKKVASKNINDMSILEINSQDDIDKYAEEGYQYFQGKDETMEDFEQRLNILSKYPLNTEKCYGRYMYKDDNLLYEFRENYNGFVGDLKNITYGLDRFAQRANKNKYYPVICVRNNYALDYLYNPHNAFLLWEYSKIDYDLERIAKDVCYYYRGDNNINEDIYLNLLKEKIINNGLYIEEFTKDKDGIVRSMALDWLLKHNNNQEYTDIIENMSDYDDNLVVRIRKNILKPIPVENMFKEFINTISKRKDGKYAVKIGDDEKVYIYYPIFGFHDSYYSDKEIGEKSYYFYNDINDFFFHDNPYYMTNSEIEKFINLFNKFGINIKDKSNKKEFLSSLYDRNFNDPNFLDLLIYKLGSPINIKPSLATGSFIPFSFLYRWRLDEVFDYVNINDLYIPNNGNLIREFDDNNTIRLKDYNTENKKLVTDIYNWMTH